MKLCSNCSTDYTEDFKFCPECGHQFGGDAAKEKVNKLNQHLFGMKHAAEVEGARSRQVFSGKKIGD